VIGRRLFNTKGYTDEGKAVAKALEMALEPVIKIAADDGMDMRDIQAVLLNVVMMTTVEAMARQRLDEVKKEYVAKIIG